MTTVLRIGLVVPSVYPVPELLSSLAKVVENLESKGHEVTAVVVDDTGHPHEFSEYSVQWAERHTRYRYVVQQRNLGQHPATWVGIQELPALDFLWIMDDDLVWEEDLSTLLTSLFRRDEELLYVVAPEFPLVDSLKVFLLRLASWLVFGKLPPPRGSSQRLLKGSLLERCRVDASLDPYVDARLWRLARGMGFQVAAYRKIPRHRGQLRYTLKGRVQLLWCALFLHPNTLRKRLLLLSPAAAALSLWMFGAAEEFVLLALAPFLLGAALTLWLRPCVTLPHDHTVF